MNQVVQRLGQWFTLHETIVPWFLFIGLLTIYLAFPTRNYYWDGITFARAIENASDFKSLIHPSHLLYNVVGYSFFHLLRRVGFDLRAVTALQILNAFLSAAAAIVFFFILKSVLRSLYLATSLTLLFGLSATWWKFSTDADAYIISVLLLLIGFHFILRPDRPRPVVLAIFYTLSMCFHELAIFFGPVVSVGLVYQHQATTKQKVRSLLWFWLLSVVLTSTIYFYCFYIATHKVYLTSFVRWLTYYSPDASFTFNVWNDLGYTTRGHFRLFLSGRLNLLQGLLNPAIAVLIALLVIVLSLLLYLVFRRLRLHARQSVRNLLTDRHGRPALIVAAVWASVYLVFLFVWLPQNTFYRLFYLPALIVLIGLLAWIRYPHGEYRPGYRVLALAIAAGLANFLFFIFPYSHTQKFPPTRFALEMNAQWHGKTLVYYDAENSDNNLVRYFAPNTTWVQLTDPGTVENEMKILSPDWNVWLETTAVDRLASTPEGAEWLKLHGKPNSRRVLDDKGFRMEFVQMLR